jgi:hypothetical protein
MDRAPGAHRLPHAACTPAPARRVAPRDAPARRRPTASHGVEAPVGMALAKVLDSANAEGPSPASGEGRDGCVASLTLPPLPSALVQVASSGEGIQGGLDAR